MTRVYGYMFLGLIVSALTAAMFAYVPDCREFLYSVGKTGETTLSVSGWIVLLAPLAIVLFTGGLMKQLSAGAMMIVFVFFCALMGASLSSVFLVYTEASIMMCFVTASATFGAMALFGLTTQTDLTSWGSVLLMALFGLIVAMVVNIFFKSAAMDFVISLVAVVVFCALTAYDSRKIREELDNCYDDEEASKRDLGRIVALSRLCQSVAASSPSVRTKEMTTAFFHKKGGRICGRPFLCRAEEKTAERDL